MKLMNCQLTAVRRQHGAVLIITLLVLVVLTMIGVTSMRENILEENMSGNMRDQTLAFQAAEAALRDAEHFLDGIVSTAAFDGTGGLYGETNAEPDYFSDNSWSTANSLVFSGTIAGVNNQPRYIVKYLGETVSGSTQLNMGGYGAASGATLKQFRITARGTGGSDNAQVTLQSHYARKF